MTPSMFQRGSAPQPQKLTVILALLLVLSYLAAFHGYGFQLEDEGTILQQVHRTAAGQLPYRDFATGYTPGFFWLNAMVFNILGESVGALRIFLLVIHSLTAAGLLLISSRLMRPSMALWPALLWFVFLPLFGGEFCSFNVPYPSWFATAGFVWAALAAMHWREEKRTGWLVIASLACALALACKPNSGAFAFAALASVILRADQTAKDPFWWLAWCGIAALLGLAFGARLISVDFGIYLAPLLAVMICLAAGRLRQSGCSSSAGLGLGAWTATMIAAGIVTLPWVVFLLATLGLSSFIRDVTLIGSGAELIYYIPFPLLRRVPAAAVSALTALGILGIVLRKTHSTRSALAALTAVSLCAVAALLAVATGALIPEGFVKSVIWQLESTAFPLSLAVQWVALVMVARGLAGQSETGWQPRGLALRVETLVIFSLFMFLQLYPRADFMHLVNAAPLALVTGFLLLEQSNIGWARACRQLGCEGIAGWVGRVAVAAVAGVVLIRLVPSLEALVSRPRYSLISPRAELALASQSADLLVELDAVVKELQSLTLPSETVFTFPALAAVNFLAQREAPTPHDYFFPGRPHHGDEAQMIDILRRDAPRAVVTLNRDHRFFGASPGYYFMLRSFIEERYRLLRQIGRFDILGPRGLEKEAGIAVADGSGALPGRAPQRLWKTTAATESGFVRLIAGAELPLTRRRAVAELLSRLERAPDGHGLERWVRDAGLSRSQEILFLRALRDYGDERAAPYLLRALTRGDKRIAAGALEAVSWVGERITARGFRWAVAGRGGDQGAGASERFRPQLEAWLEPGRAGPAARAFAVKALGRLGALASRGILAQTFTRDPVLAVRVAAAAALVNLGVDDFGCHLVEMLAAEDNEVRALVPSLVLELYRRRPEKIRPCIALAVRQGAAKGASERSLEHARLCLWIAGVAKDQELRPLLRAMAGGPRPVAEPAGWALTQLRRAGRKGGDRRQ